MIRLNVSSLCLAACLAAVGCNVETMRVVVQSPRDTNGGRPVRILVRAVDSQDYLNESYASAADKVINHNESVLDSAVVYPGVPLYLKIKRVVNKSLAFYVFFTSPGSRWKALLEAPPPYAVTMKLGLDNIETLHGK